MRDRRVVAFDLFGTDGDGVEPRGSRRERGSCERLAKREPLFTVGFGHQNNSTAIFLALCRVSVTNGSFSERREAIHERLGARR